MTHVLIIWDRAIGTVSHVTHITCLHVNKKLKQRFRYSHTCIKVFFTIISKYYMMCSKLTTTISTYFRWFAGVNYGMALICLSKYLKRAIQPNLTVCATQANTPGWSAIEIKGYRRWGGLFLPRWRGFYTHVARATAGFLSVIKTKVLHMCGSVLLTVFRLLSRLSFVFVLHELMLACVFFLSHTYTQEVMTRQSN